MAGGGAKRDRSVYLVGPKRGQPRPSVAVRKRKRIGRACEGWRAERRLLEEFVREVDEEELEEAEKDLGTEAKTGEWKKFRLGRGYREDRDGPTGCSLYDEEESEWLHKLVLVSAADVESGRRWFAVGYPDDWKERYTKSEMVRAARRSGADVGKTFVEYRGRWYEATEDV
jgi:hypothetical protein